MPYNTNPIMPTAEVTGTVSLPLARVKKIISADEDISACSNNAAFAIAVATEMFIQHLAEQTYNVVKSEKKPRRNVQYRDVANAVARVDNLEFLADVVPKTTTYRAFKERKNNSKAGVDSLANGQRTMEQMTRQPAAEDARIYDLIDDEDDADGQVHRPYTNGHAYDGVARSPEPAHAQEPNRAAAVQARHAYDAVHDAELDAEMVMEE